MAEEIDLTPDMLAAEGELELDASDLAPVVDAGPEARRAASGAPPTPKSLREVTPDESEPIRDVYINPLVAKAFPSVAEALKKPPQNAKERAHLNELSRLVSAQQGLNEAQRTIGGMAIAGPAMAAGKGMAAAAGAGPRLASLFGGATAGGVATGISEAKPENIPQGAAVGAALNGLGQTMKFIVNRVAAPGTAKAFARAGAEIGPNAKVPNASLADAAGVARRYEIAGINNPEVAKEAVDGAIKKATTTMNSAWEIVRNTSGDLSKNPLSVQAMKEYNQALTDVRILKAMQPVANRLAAAHALRPTMMERVGEGVKKALPYAAGAGLGRVIFGGSGEAK